MKKVPTIGRHFGKWDYDRMGLFAEMSYLHGKGYTGPLPYAEVRDPAGRQMTPGPVKWKAGLQDCYFDKKFRRIFQGEGIPRREPPAQGDKKGEKSKKGEKVAVFKPPSCPHKHSTPADWYGCFGFVKRDMYKALDPRVRKVEKAPEPPKLFIPPSPGKRGGPGYVGTTFKLNGTTGLRYPKYMPSPYDPKPPAPEKGGVPEKTWKLAGVGGRYFNTPKMRRTDWKTYREMSPVPWTLGDKTFLPNSATKSLGGGMSGCFERWPKHLPEPYIDPYKLDKYQEKLAESNAKKTGGGGNKKPKKEGKTTAAKFFPQSRNKSYPIASVMEEKVKVATNQATWRTMKPITYTREFF